MNLKIERSLSKIKSNEINHLQRKKNVNRPSHDSTKKMLYTMFSTFLILVTFCKNVEGWIGVPIPQNRPESPCKLLRLENDSSPSIDTSSRRGFLLDLTSCIVMGAASVVVPLPATVASAADDPFAELDDIAAKIKGEYSSYPNSISPLPTYKTTAKELIEDDNGGTAASKNDQPKVSGGSSDLDKALQDISKQKRIDPRTHG